MINWAHVHLMINHIPVIGIPGVVLLLIYAIIRRSDEVRTISFGLFVLIALMTVAVYFTGEGAQKVVKNIPGVTESYIGNHEEMGEYSVVLTVLLGLASIVALIIRYRTGTVPKYILTVVLLMSIIVSVVLGITANLGGQIRHTEIRDKTTVTVVP